MNEFLGIAMSSALHSGILTPIGTTYVSLLVTLFASFMLIMRLWREKREARSMDEAQPYAQFIKVVLRSTIPSLVLGFVHLGLLAGYQRLLIGLNAVWFSSTVCVDHISWHVIF